ncbi:hypothetical protein HYV50_04080 [Candidatus Pacearchaeota archaeon]|nr:hypothetical protein [Candidatus Pacearchaeota archaeon]
MQNIRYDRLIGLDFSDIRRKIDAEEKARQEEAIARAIKTHQILFSEGIDTSSLFSIQEVELLDYLGSPCELRIYPSGFANDMIKQLDRFSHHDISEIMLARDKIGKAIFDKLGKRVISMAENPRRDLDYFN